MKSVWKYELNRSLKFDMPIGAEILTVQTQFGIPCMWVLVQPDMQRVTRKFVIKGTGTTFEDEKFQYIGTFQERGGALILHLFEMTNETS